jgi:putative hydrolase of the HAD superfamily
VTTSTRAIVFDLDDTLYPYRMFVRSGLRTVAERLAKEAAIGKQEMSRHIAEVLATSERGQELQALCARLALEPSLMPALVDMVRAHAPSIRLPRESRHVLMLVRRSWRVGILTNGTPAVQRRKIAALGVEALVDEIVVAEEIGAGAAKPSRRAFDTVLARLGGRAGETVFVGDDLKVDIRGALAAGLKAIHLDRAIRRGQRRCKSNDCGIHAARIGDVPAMAEQLVPCGMSQSLVMNPAESSGPELSYDV